MSFDKLIADCFRSDVALDVDGCLVDFGAHLRGSLGIAQDFAIDQWHFIEAMDEGTRKRAHVILDDPDWWRHIPLIDGASEAVLEIKKAARAIHYVTSPWLSCKGWGHARRALLAHHFGAHHSDVAIMSCKDRFDADIIIDDKPENVESFVARRMGLRIGWLHEQPHNADHTWSRRVRWPR